MTSARDNPDAIVRRDGLLFPNAAVLRPARETTLPAETGGTVVSAGVPIVHGSVSRSAR
jgi:hypothetical protein